MFQFPSNGKADPKLNCYVSVATYITSFNSLQTGKRIQRRARFVKGVIQRLTCSSFNSLQTGKRIQRNIRNLGRNLAYVSIPFKRESGSKDNAGPIITSIVNLVSIPFKRESGSKVFISPTRTTVAYCFNSLQTGKRIQRIS